MTALYTFAVVEQPVALPDQGDGPADLRVVSAGGVAAVAEPVDVAEYESPRLEENLKDEAWLEGAVRHHERVIEELLDRTAVVPMRFGSIFSDEAGLRSMLEENADAFAQLLDTVRGRAEWGVRVLADRAALTSRVAPSTKTATSGSDYLRRRKAQLQASDQIGDLAAQIADEIHQRLTEVAEQSAVLQPRRADPELVLSAAYLVPRGGEERLLAAVGELHQAHADVTIDVTGPWPAYSFTSADVGGPRG
jgi:hypothetical protein